MPINHLSLFILFFFFIVFQAEAQNKPVDSTTHYFAQRPQIADISLSTIRDFGLTAHSDEFGDAQGEIGQNLRRDAFLRFPIYIKNQLLVGLGLVYRHEQFRFEEVDPTNYSLYTRLQDKGLRRTGIDLLFQKTCSRNRIFQGSLNIRLNGDTYQGEIHRFLKASLILNRIKRKNKRTQIGWGIVGGYDLGTPVAYPIFIYKHFFNPHLQLNLSLPKQASLSYGFSDKMFLTFTSEISGASYRIEDQLLKDFNRLEIRKSEFRAKLRFDRELHDWLWFGVEFGLLKYINFFVSKPQDFRNDAIIELDPVQAHFFKFSLFAVIPNKFQDIIR